MGLWLSINRLIEILNASGGWCISRNNLNRFFYQSAFSGSQQGHQNAREGKLME
jgi:hypothetical protein